MKHFLGFAIREEEKQTGFLFKRKTYERFFSTVRVGADNFVEAQQIVYDKMQEFKMPVVIITPFTEEDGYYFDDEDEEKEE